MPKLLKHLTVTVVCVGALASCDRPSPQAGGNAAESGGAAAETSGAAAAASGADRTGNPLIGTWELVDWRSVDGSGEVTFPWGEDPRGQIIYSAERMSAQLMRLPDSGEGPEGFRDLSYWGTYDLDEENGTVTHHVLGSSSESWVGSDQLRGFRLDGPDRVTLLVLGRVGEERSSPSSELTWERVR